jgi:hypothetical protein
VTPSSIIGTTITYILKSSPRRLRLATPSSIISIAITYSLKSPPKRPWSATSSSIIGTAITYYLKAVSDSLFDRRYSYYLLSKIATKTPAVSDSLLDRRQSCYLPPILILLATDTVPDYSTYSNIVTIVLPGIGSAGRFRRHQKAFNTRGRGTKYISNIIRKPNGDFPVVLDLLIHTVSCASSCQNPPA